MDLENKVSIEVKSMIIEVITQNIEDTQQAFEFGADRVELVSAMAEGGLTPSYGTLASVLPSTKQPVQVMVRPHGFGFIYYESDRKTIQEDIKVIQELGGNRIVFGCLTPEGTIDERLLATVIEQYPELDITFHRAFDQVISQTESYKVLLKYKANVKRILTSGGKPKCSEAIMELQQLVKLSSETAGPAIMPGSGLAQDNIQFIHEQVSATQYHFGSGVRINGQFNQGFDPSKLKRIRNLLA